MAKRHFRNRDASLWQSAADQMISKSSAGRALDVGGPAVMEPADPKLPEMAAVDSIAASTSGPEPETVSGHCCFKL